jgi:hypothetical protein
MSDIAASLIMASPLLVGRKNHNEYFDALKNLYLKSNEIVCAWHGFECAGYGYGQTLTGSALPPCDRPT